MFLFLAGAILTGSIGDFTLENGKVIPDCKITYQLHGKLNEDRSNIVVVPTWFNGTSVDFSAYVRPGGLVDSNKFHVVVIDALGNGMSSSPSNHPSLKGARFPEITIGDMVAAEHALVTKLLGFQHVHAVLGVSMGGMQAFQWMVKYPRFMDKGVTIVGTPRMGARDILLWSNFFQMGKSKQAPGKPSEAEEAPRNPLEKWLKVIVQGASMYPKYKEPFNALRQFSAIGKHDIGGVSGGSLEQAASLIQARTLAAIATEDQALSPQTAQEFARMLKSVVVEMRGPCGHNAYKCEIDQISKPIDEFLSK